MNPKYQKVLSDIEKAEKKKSEIEGQLKELYDKKTELENLEIINTVRDSDGKPDKGGDGFASRLLRPRRRVHVCRPHDGLHVCVPAGVRIHSAHARADGPARLHHRARGL